VKGAVFALLIILPSRACAEGTPNQEFSFISSFIQMIAALSIVVGLILLAKYFSGKFMGAGAPSRLASCHIRLVETRYIAPKKAIILIEVGGEFLLLASAENQLTLLKKVNVIEEINVFKETGSTRSDFYEKFRAYAGKWRG
jgi:flagellar protein FliO/FliZ